MSVAGQTATAPLHPPSTRRAAIAFIFVTVMLDMLALGMIIPVLPLLIEMFRGGDTASAARMVGIFGASWAAVQFVAAPLLGSLSDRFGRRPVVLLSNFGLGLDYMLMALAPSLGWLFVGRIISGITSASVPTAYAYIADVTPPERRARSYGLLGAAFGIGFVVGPALGGVLGAWGPRTPFWVAAGLSLANACYGYFILPESLAADHRSPFSWKRANPMGALRLLRSTRALSGLAAVHALYHLAHHSLSAVFVLNVAYRFGWTSMTVGLTLAATGVCSAIVQAGLVGRIVARVGERRTLLAGLTAGVIGFAAYGIAPTGATFLLAVPILAFWGMYSPAVQGLITRMVGRDRQGALQGAFGSVQMAMGIFGPVLFADVFARSIAPDVRWHVPGAPFLLAAVLLLVAIVVARTTFGATES
ncbi:MAG: tetracycline resistance MFS efflux pump [Acidobacteria bacterium SCN 69-37]|nr:MAG: tetracycline resistance MFS efflux pump [Acidobacteria bacterium SCN 69-37]